MTSSKMTFGIEGLGCVDCVAVIENAVIPLAGVSYVGVSLSGRTMTVRPGAGFDLAAMVSRVTALGYGIGDVGSEAPPGTPCRCRSPK